MSHLSFLVHCPGFRTLLNILKFFPKVPCPTIFFGPSRVFSEKIPQFFPVSVHTITRVTQDQMYHSNLLKLMDRTFLQFLFQNSWIPNGAWPARPVGPSAAGEKFFKNYFPNSIFVNVFRNLKLVVFERSSRNFIIKQFSRLHVAIGTCDCMGFLKMNFLSL